MGSGGPRATPCFPIQPETSADSGVLLPRCGQGRVQVLGTMLMLSPAPGSDIDVKVWEGGPERWGPDPSRWLGMLARDRA